MKKNILLCSFSVLFCALVAAAVFTVTALSDEERTAVETFEYSVYKLFLKLGSVKLEYVGPTEIDGTPVELIRFTATGPNFFDKDNIYIDPETYRPVRVDREVKIFGKEESIVEYYDQQEGQVRIIKNVDQKSYDQVLKKDGPLDNIYGFIFKFRQEGSMNVGDEVFIRLPTKDVTMKYIDQREYSWNGEKRKTAYLESDPKEFRIWFDLERDFLPLRIDGAVGFGKTAMILKDYSRR